VQLIKEANILLQEKLTKFEEEENLENAKKSDFFISLVR